MDRQQAIDALMAVISDRSYGIEARVGAVRGLGHAGGAEARAFLARVMVDRASGLEMRSAAAEALGRASRE